MPRLIGSLALLLFGCGQVYPCGRSMFTGGAYVSWVAVQVGGDGESGVGGRRIAPLRRVVLPVRRTSDGRAAATAMAASSMDRKLRASGVKPHERRVITGITKQAIWALEASGISVASFRT